MYAAGFAQFGAAIPGNYAFGQSAGVAAFGDADFEIRIPKGGHTSALTECVITWDCGTELRKTRGVHVNQVFAGILATIKLINIQLHEKANTALA